MTATPHESTDLATSSTPTGPELPADGEIVMLSTSWCGYCARLKTQLKSAAIPFSEIDIEQNSELIDFVEAANGGNRTVPTVVFPDGSTATNPSLAQVKTKLGIADTQ